MPSDPPKVPDGSDALDDPKLGSTQEMGRRLNALPDGHPSSPHNEDGSHKSPVIRWQDIELPEPGDDSPSAGDRPKPFADAEHVEHVQEVRERLDKARADGLVTNQQQTIDRAGQIWSDERDACHDSIIEDLYERSADVPNDGNAIVAGGLGGSGKSTVLGQYAGIDRSQYLTINPDDIKEEMASRGLIPQVDGLSPMEASDLAHEESSYLARQLALRAQADGKNLIWDITMSSRTSTDERIDDLRSAGYIRIEGIFVDIPVETSVARANARHREGHDDYLAGKGLGGRFVPEEVILGQADPKWGSINRMIFESVKHKFDRWSMYDNSVDGGIPVLADASQQEEKTS